MFRISKAEEQALRLTMRLAAVGSQQTLGELAEAEQLPEPTVAKLLGQLRRGEVVDAVRGRHGGYVLADDASRISAARVLRAVATRSVFGYPCQNQGNPGDCAWSQDCGMRPIWRLLEKRVNLVLEQTTGADMIQREAIVSESVERGWPRTGE